MIDRLQIKQYRKLKNITIDLSSEINIISGTNGTCKSSILYMISNSFQEVTSKAEWLKSKEIISVIRYVNNGMNLKIERLTKGDDKYSDPAYGFKGSLFKCLYEDGIELEFRRHNTNLEDKSRFALKPNYPKGSSQKLPALPVLYLGLSRLYSFGEYKNQDMIKVKKNLPIEYAQIVAEIYRKFTGITISIDELQEMGDIKKRSKFNTDKEGIDSNTISAGEDNLLILLNALVSLRYYYENINSSRSTESIMLIDEVDATLHPAYQIKLLNIFIEYAQKYKIKFVFTTHSISLLEAAFIKKCNVIYLVDNIESVIMMEDSDIYKIKMYLHNQTKEDIYINRSIPIFTEDEEARIFLRHLFAHFERKYNEKFRKVQPLFHFVEVNVSGDALVGIFKDDKLLRSTMRSICIIDGDKKASENLSNYTICLPGENSPESLVFEYAKYLYKMDETSFWQDSTIHELGYTRVLFRDSILDEIDSIDKKLEALKEEGKSTKGVTREENKKLFTKYRRFFEFVMIKWIADHEQLAERFYNNLFILFKKVSEFHDINPNEWER